MMAPSEKSLDFVRHLVLHLLMSGPQDLEYIKKTVLHTMSYRLDEAGGFYSKFDNFWIA